MVKIYDLLESTIICIDKIAMQIVIEKQGLHY